MLSVATKRCPRCAASGVRWALVVAFACLNNLAVASFVPVASRETFEAEPQFSVLTMYVFDSAGAGAGESTTTAAASESSNPTPPQDHFPDKQQRFACLPIGLGEWGDSVSPLGGQPKLSLSCPLLSEAAILHAAKLASRLNAFESIRLPPKLRYQLFRPPKCDMI